MAVRRLNHAVLYVHGLERTVRFYTQTLGFEVSLEIPGQAAFLRAPGSANDHDLGLFETSDGIASIQSFECSSNSSEPNAILRFSNGPGEVKPLPVQQTPGSTRVDGHW